jgi:glutamine cyclotransferase
MTHSNDQIPKKPGIQGYAFFLSLLIIVLASCHNDDRTPEAAPTEPARAATPIINYAVVKYHDHDTSLFTEGFLFHEGELWESTGSPEQAPNLRSMVGVIDLATGKFTKKLELDRSKYFGEGITFLHGNLYQLTYKNKLGFIYDAKTLKQKGTFTYSNKEGWSLTTDGHQLIMSDGTPILTFLDPVTLKPVRSLPVTLDGNPQDSLNELEYIKGYIYANVWMSPWIVKIDPASGKVVGRMDMSSLLSDARNRNSKSDVLNGIAYDSTTDRIFVTGKQWPNIYQIGFAH